MRIYYLNRSQPPLLALMVQDLAQAYRMHFQNLKAIKL
jgi:neutral trehalase